MQTRFSISSLVTAAPYHVAPWCVSMMNPIRLFFSLSEECFVSAAWSAYKANCPLIANFRFALFKYFFRSSHLFFRWFLWKNVDLIYSYSKDIIPQHTSLKLVANCRQPLTGRYSRLVRRWKNAATSAFMYTLMSFKERQ